MIFKAQEHLMAKYHHIEKTNGAAVITSDLQGNLDNRQVQARMHELYGFLVRELSEAMQELKNKPWKQTDRPTDYQAFVGEMGDCLHFFVEMCITAGMTADDLHRAYFREFQKNNQRIDSGTY